MDSQADIAAVIAEMRSSSEAVDCGEEPPPSAGMVKKWADRLESAMLAVERRPIITVDVKTLPDDARRVLYENLCQMYGDEYR